MSSIWNRALGRGLRTRGRARRHRLRGLGRLELRRVLAGDPLPFVQSIGLDDSVAWTGDLNGDRRADVVWTKRSTGASSSWLMNGKTRIGTWAALGNDRWSIARRPGA